MNDVNIDELRKQIEPVFRDMENDIKETEQEDGRIIKSYLENNSGNVLNLRSK